MNNNDNYYELFMDLFEAVINNSTWGNSKNGGPVWIWDFRIENLKKLIPAHPLLQELDEEKTDYMIVIYMKLQTILSRNCSYAIFSLFQTGLYIEKSMYIFIVLFLSAGS